MTAQSSTNHPTVGATTAARTQDEQTRLEQLGHRFAEALTVHDVDALAALLHPDYVNHNPYVPPLAGPASALAFFTGWLSAFPDAVITAEAVYALPGDRPGTGIVVGRYTYTGTFRAPILDLPPTGKRTVMRSIDIWTVRDGLLVEHWDELNTADWFAQLTGADPQPRTGARS